jgi:hypothetical protein
VQAGHSDVLPAAAADAQPRALAIGDGVFSTAVYAYAGTELDPSPSTQLEAQLDGDVAAAPNTEP